MKDLIPCLPSLSVSVSLCVCLSRQIVNESSVDRPEVTPSGVWRDIKLQELLSRGLSVFLSVCLSLSSSPCISLSLSLSLSDSPSFFFLPLSLSQSFDLRLSRSPSLSISLCRCRFLCLCLSRSLSLCLALPLLLSLSVYCLLPSCFPLSLSLSLSPPSSLLVHSTSIGCAALSHFRPSRFNRERGVERGLHRPNRAKQTAKCPPPRINAHRSE